MDQPGLKKMKTLKGFLREEFGTEDVSKVNPGELKEKIEGEKMNKRSEYRKGFTNMLQGKRPKIDKGSDEKFESNFASGLSKDQRNEYFGFQTLQYTVSEACGNVDIKVLNKTGAKNTIGIRTKD